jgi:maleate isomerase
VQHINDSEVRFLARNGIERLRKTGLGINDPAGMFAVEPAKWRDLVLENRNPDADACFISCTAVPSLEIIAGLEAELGKPVITSNLVMGWHALRSLGIEDRHDDLGVFFSRY